MNTDLYFYLLIPASLSIVTFILLRHRGAADIAKFVAIGWVISSLILAGCFYAGKGIKTMDTEIINGEVISKSREHGSYVRSYSCNCVTTCSGSGNNRSCSQRCQTCYENHYTVEWSCDSNIGPFRIEYLDETSRSVYNTPDPLRYTVINKGDPVSKTQSYTNYIKAVPETLFRPASKALLAKYSNSIPEYPIFIYDIYKVNRVIPIGVTLPNLQKWNDALSDAVKTLGPSKQANVVVVLTKYDPDFFYALQDAWANGKKNDIVAVIGVDGFKPKWVRIMALTQDEIFQVKLRDRLLALPELTSETVIGSIKSEAMQTFKRKRMRDFAYLEAEIDPPLWLMIFASILIICSYVGFFIAVLRGSI